MVIKKEVDTNSDNHLIAELISVRAAYNQTFYELQKEKETVASLQLELKSMTNKLKTADSELQVLREDKKILASFELQSKSLTDQLNATNLDLQNLQKEKKTLQARMKQFQCGVNQNIEHYHKEEEKDEDENEYEVERILAHKFKKQMRYFFVKWKGYDSSQNSWEPETNLSCPRVLNEYLNLKNIK